MKKVTRIECDSDNVEEMFRATSVQNRILRINEMLTEAYEMGLDDADCTAKDEEIQRLRVAIKDLDDQFGFATYPEWSWVLG